MAVLGKEQKNSADALSASAVVGRLRPPVHRIRDLKMEATHGDSSVELKDPGLVSRQTEISCVYSET